VPVTVKHHHQTAIPNDPTRDISATAWEEYHDIVGLGTMAEKDDAVSDGKVYARRNAAWSEIVITGSAAVLASANPVLLAGQVGYETDTLSFKIGDGSTAYNALTYAYRGLPVAGEPSLGTPHPTSDANRTATLVVNTSTSTLGVWSAAVTMTGVPTGARAAWCQAEISKSGVDPYLRVEAASGFTLSDITSGDDRFKYHGIGPIAGVATHYGLIRIHLDSNGQFKWCVSNTNCTLKIGSAIDYEI
jgi:hypothetical protein